MSRLEKKNSQNLKCSRLGGVLRGPLLGLKKCMLVAQS